MEWSPHRQVMHSMSDAFSEGLALLDEKARLASGADPPGVRRVGDRPIERNPNMPKYRIQDTLADCIGERAVSRLFEMCVRVRLDVQDYRKRR